MAADTPYMFILAGLLEMLVAEHHVVDILDLKRHVIEADFVTLDADEGVMIDEILAAVAAIESSDHVVPTAGIDLVRANEPEQILVPLDHFMQLRRHQ